MSFAFANSTSNEGFICRHVDRRNHATIGGSLSITINSVYRTYAPEIRSLPGQGANRIISRVQITVEYARQLSFHEGEV